MVLDRNLELDSLNYDNDMVMFPIPNLMFWINRMGIIAYSTAVQVLFDID
jgi:hypothetical protein